MFVGFALSVVSTSLTVSFPSLRHLSCQRSISVSIGDSSSKSWSNVTLLRIDSIIDDKTTHELYLWSFAEAVRAGTAHVMYDLFC